MEEIIESLEKEIKSNEKVIQNKNDRIKYLENLLLRNKIKFDSFYKEKSFKNIKRNKTEIQKEKAQTIANEINENSKSSKKFIYKCLNMKKEESLNTLLFSQAKNNISNQNSKSGLGINYNSNFDIEDSLIKTPDDNVNIKKSKSRFYSHCKYKKGIFSEKTNKQKIYLSGNKNSILQEVVYLNKTKALKNKKIKNQNHFITDKILNINKLLNNQRKYNINKMTCMNSTETYDTNNLKNLYNNTTFSQESKENTTLNNKKPATNKNIKTLGNIKKEVKIVKIFKTK